MSEPFLCGALYDRGTLFATVQLYPQRVLRKIDRNDRRYAQRRRNYSEKIYRHVQRVHPAN